MENSSLKEDLTVFKTGVEQRSNVIIDWLAQIEAFYLLKKAYQHADLREQLYLLAGASIRRNQLESPNICLDLLSGKRRPDKQRLEKINLRDDLYPFEFTRITIDLFKELNTLATSKKLSPSEIALIADFITRLLSVIIWEKGGSNPLVGSTYEVQMSILDALLVSSFKLGDFKEFAKKMSQVCRIDFNLTEVDLTKKRLNSSQLEQTLGKRQMNANFLIDLAIRRYFQSGNDDIKLQGRIINLIHLISGFLNCEDIRKTINPNLSQAYHIYTTSEISRTLGFLKELKRECDILSE